MKIGDKVKYSFSSDDKDAEYKGEGVIFEFKKDWGYLVEHDNDHADIGDISDYWEIIDKDKCYIWIDTRKELEKLTAITIPDTKLARKLYKNTITRIENGKIYF